MGDVVSLSEHRPTPQRGGNNKGRRRSFGNIRQLPSKRYQASFQGPDGKRHNAPTTFQTKTDARAWLDMQSAAITEQRWKPAPPKQTSETLADFTVRWLEARSSGALGAKPLTPRTVGEYRRMAKSFTECGLGAKPLPQVTSADVRAWHAAQDPNKATTRAHTYALLKTVLAAAVDDELIPTNPARIRGAGTSKSSRTIRPASVAELQQIADVMPERYRAMVHVAAWCALRFGELTELRRKDIDLKEAVIHVRRGVTWVKDGDGKAVARVGAPKTAAGVRDVHIPPHIVPLLADHIAAWANPGADGLLFPNTEGGHLHHGSLYKVFRRARAAAGRPDLRWHDLRHTGATLAATAGATTRELMSRLGHSTVNVAMRYQHAAAERDAELATRLSELAQRE